MSGLELEIVGLAPVIDALRRLGDADGQRAILEVIGSEVESQTRRRLQTEKTAPDGSSWDPWSDSYAARRPSKGGLLDLHGDLIDSITADDPRGDSVEVGSNLVYARRQNAAREFIGISSANEAQIDDVLSSWLGGLVA